VNNLRVDVILESEQRSTSPVDIKTVARIAVGSLLALLVIGILYSVWGAKSAQRRKIDFETEWAARSKLAARIRQDTNDLYQYTDIHNEVAGWEKSRILWHQHLADFQALVPPNIQITSFLVDEQVPVAGKVATRNFTLNLQGRAEGENPRSIVDGFLAALRHGAGFSNMVESASVVKIDTVPGDERPHRVFTISVKYRPRSY